MIIKITKKISGERLDKFLTRRDNVRKNKSPRHGPASASPWRGDKLSRNQIQQLVETGSILVNNLPATSHYRLKPGDNIKIKKITKLGANQKLAGEKESKLKLPPEIIGETADYLIINKPAGLSVHGPDDFTLAKWLVAEYPVIKNVGDDPERPGIVHRLDKDVSGLMVVAKTQTSFDSLKKQFQNRSVIKEYTALAYGKIQKDNGLINFPIKRARDGFKMAALPLTVKGETSGEGRQAETQFEVTKKLINYTLLKVKIKTGRTHQIRVHLAAYGNPLVGDNIYATAKARTANKKLGLKRIFLIADHLSFIDLTGKRTDFKIDLTEELKNILKIVK